MAQTHIEAIANTPDDDVSWGDDMRGAFETIAAADLETPKAPADHHHDADYADIDHDHDDDYAPAAHVHWTHELVIYYDADTASYPTRETVTDDPTRPVTWVGPEAPIIGADYAQDNVDFWRNTSVSV